MEENHEHSYKVLVADDEPHGRERLIKLLGGFPGFSVSALAETGTQAAKALCSGGFDLAFLDIDMPGMTGIEVVRELTKAGTALPYIVFVTAFAQHGAAAYDLGAVDYLVKPVSEFRLRTALERFAVISRTKQKHREPLDERLVSMYGLTEREAEICLLAREGLVREEIQSRAGISEATLKTHLSNIYEKTGLSNLDDPGRGDKFSRLLYLLFTIE